MMRWAPIAILCGLVASASADAEFENGSVIFARGYQLIQLQPKTKTEVTVATFSDRTGIATKTPHVTRLLRLIAIGKPPTVRSLSTDVAANVLLANLDGQWHWMPLDGSTKTLTALPCADGAATLTPEGDSVACRSDEGRAMIVNVRSNKPSVIDNPGSAGVRSTPAEGVRRVIDNPGSAGVRSTPAEGVRRVIDAPSGRLTGPGTNRRLVWADKGGVWSAPLSDRKAAKRVAPEAPKRGFLASPDGTRAVGIYDDEVYIGVRNKVPAEVLMSFALDGEGARRKAIRSGVPVEWSHDSQWVLVQDGGKACLMQATGGEYKCWAGYTAVSVSPNGKHALLLGSRDRVDPKPTKKSRRRKSRTPPIEQDNPNTQPPTGLLSLYRARLEGSAYTERPTLVAKIVDGAAVWIPPPR